MRDLILIGLGVGLTLLILFTPLRSYALQALEWAWGHTGEAFLNWLARR